MQLNYRQKNNGMYILSKQDIDDISAAVLTEYSPKNLLNAIPLDTVDLLENYLGLTVKRKYIGTVDSEILGLTVMDDYAEIPSYDNMLRPVVLEETYGTVLINPNLAGRASLTRRRFTEMHEGAHFILHKEYFNSTHKGRGTRLNYIACRQVELERINPRGRMEWLEWQADSLAAALLMPRNIFIIAAADSFKKHGVYDKKCFNTDIPEERVMISCVASELSKTFQVSCKAAKLRLKNLGFLQGRI